MKKNILLGFLILFLGIFTPSCQFTPSQDVAIETIGRPITTIIVKKYIDKKPKNRLGVINLIQLLENYSGKSLDLKDFAELSKSAKLDSDWALLMKSIYDQYKPSIKVDSNEAEKIKVYILGILNDAVLLAEAQK